MVKIAQEHKQRCAGEGWISAPLLSSLLSCVRSSIAVFEDVRVPHDNPHWPTTLQRISENSQRLERFDKYLQRFLANLWALPGPCESLHDLPWMTAQDLPPSWALASVGSGWLSWTLQLTCCVCTVCRSRKREILLRAKWSQALYVVRPVIGSVDTSVSFQKAAPMLELNLISICNHGKCLPIHWCYLSTLLGKEATAIGWQFG